MADPYGLVTDESDYLTIPSLLARSQEDRYYLSYSFGYSDISNMDASVSGSNHNLSGDATSNDILIGGIHTFDFGKLGLFLTANLKDADASGPSVGGGVSYDSDVMQELQDVAMKLYYARTFDSLDFGASAGVEYNNQENRLKQEGDEFILNYIWGQMMPVRALDVFALPQDSEAWKGNASLAVSKDFGSSDISFVIGGNAILSGENQYRYQYDSHLFAGNTWDVSIKDNDLEAYDLHAELRYTQKLQDGYSLPFLASAQYSSWNFSGSGIGTGAADSGVEYLASINTEALILTVGGGVNKQLAAGLLAGGLYYSYIDSTAKISRARQLMFVDEYSKYPASIENRLTVKGAYETPLNEQFTFTAGLNAWKGWISERFCNSDSGTFGYSTSGDVLGILGAVGLQYAGDSFNLETYINAGYETISTSGDNMHLSQDSFNTKLGVALLF